MSVPFRSEFPYIRIEGKPLPSSKRTVVFYRPVIPILLIHRRRFVQFEALIDSGADYNVFHADVAFYLGVDLKKGAKRIISGISRGAVKGYEHLIAIKLGEHTYKGPIIFSTQIPENTLAVLGNKGFFDRFVVTLNYKAKTITLRS